MIKRLRIAEACPLDFASSVGLESPVVAQLLWNRGHRTREEIAAFLNPDWDTGTHDPSQFRHVPSALVRLFSALEKGERITVHGDYDADGVTGAAVLITTFRAIERKISNLKHEISKSNVDYYIPHRDKEGYGLHRQTVALLKERGTTLIVTVDCGISCVDEIALAKQEGIDTIVVDHHQFGNVLPDGYLIHPGLPEETYPFKKLAAVGVAFKFSCALLDEARWKGIGIPEGWEKWLLDLVAIATVTDMVPLVGENRVLERYGLVVLNKTRRVGLRALLESAGVEPGALDTESVGFSIGPRLNAAGRMDHASLALRLLLVESSDEAKILAAKLEQCNRARQDATKKMVAEAEEKLADQNMDHPLLVLWDARWSPSIVGLLAGRFMDRFFRPVVAIGCHEGRWVGSGRSFGSFDITSAMRRSGEGLLSRVGGHIQACGFSLEREEDLSILAERLQEDARASVKAEDFIPTLDVDAELPLDSVDWPLYNSLVRFAPYGEGNRQPTFVSRRCFATRIQTVGASQNHLRLTLRLNGGRSLNAIGFKLGDRASKIPYGSLVDIVYTVDVNEWNGRRDLQCKLIDIEVTSHN